MSVLEGEGFVFCYDYNHSITAVNKANITIILMVNRVSRVQSRGLCPNVPDWKVHRCNAYMV